MRRDQFRWGTGKVVYWDLDGVQSRAPLRDQIANLKEDLAQVIYPAGVVLDVGWFPEFAEEGGFVVVVARPGEFHQPLFRVTASTIGALRTAIAEAVAFAMERV